MPNGTNTIDNPLYAFEFHPVSVQDFYYDPWVSLYLRYLQHQRTHKYASGRLEDHHAFTERRPGL